MAREVRHAIPVIVSTSGLSYFLIFRFHQLVIFIFSILIFYYFFHFAPRWVFGPSVSDSIVTSWCFAMRNNLFFSVCWFRGDLAVKGPRMVIDKRKGSLIFQPPSTIQLNIIGKDLLKF